MGKILAKIRNLDSTPKILLGVATALFLGPLGILIFIPLYILLVKLNSGNPKMFEFEIEKFKQYYGVLRKYVQETNSTNPIVIGTYVSEYKGKAFMGSRFMSIYVKDLPDSVAKELSFIERAEIENDVYFQFPIKRNYSKKEKATIIRAVLDYIEENYPADKVFFDETIPSGMSSVGLNEIEEYFKNISEEDIKVLKN